MLLMVMITSAPSAAPPSSAVDARIDANTSEAEALWQLLTRLEPRLRRLFESDQTISAVDRLLAGDCDLPNAEQLRAEALSVQATATGRKTGLELRSAYTTDDLETDAGEASAYVELSWDVMRNGYLEHRHNAEQLQQKVALKRQHAQRSALSNRARCSQQRVNARFTGPLIELLDLKRQLMEPVHAIERRAYFKGWSGLDDYLVSEEDLHNIREELKYLLNTTVRNNDLSEISQPPLIDIDFGTLLERIRENDRHQQEAMLKSSLLEIQKTQRYENRLRLFVRKEFDVDGSNGNDDDGTVAGVRFQMPLDRKHHRRAVEFDGRALAAEASLEQWEQINETRRAYLELKEQLRRASKQRYRQQRALERVRRTLLRYKMGDEIALSVAATRMRSLLAAAIESVRANELLYQRANRLLSVAAMEYDSTLIKLAPIEENRFRGRIGRRSIYLWSEAFNNTPNHQIHELLNIKGIETALVSASRLVNKAKLARFRSDAEAYGIEVVSVLGNHQWALAEHHDEALPRIVSLAEVSGGIHLDIEPHTLRNFDSNRQTYLTDYTNLIRRVDDQLDGLPLTIAVPVHWEIATYRELARYADSLYIMAYGNPNPNRILKRLQPLLDAIPEEQIVIALRASDFSDEWEMEQAIEKIEYATGVNRFAIHQFRSFVKQAGMRP